MTLKVILRAPSVSTEAAAEFRSMARVIFGVYAVQRTNLGIPASKVTAVLADAFESEVQQRVPFGGILEAERVGGSRAIAKNLCQTDDCSEVAIVFDPEPWRSPGEDVDRLFQGDHHWSRVCTRDPGPCISCVGRDGWGRVSLGDSLRGISLRQSDPGERISCGRSG